MNTRPSRNRDIRILNTQDLVSHQIVHTTSFPTKVIAIPICQIIKKCILIRIGCSRNVTQAAVYVIPLSNSYEIH